jgi:maltose O-acetyltransferase
MAPFRCDYGYNVRIGANGFLNYDCVFLDCAPITIGHDAQIGPGVHVYTATHPTDPETRRSGLEYALPVTIEDNVWLGGGTIVRPGVTIGRDTVVGAGSVVTRPLPPGVVAAGSPCRVLRPL